MTYSDTLYYGDLYTQLIEWADKGLIKNRDHHDQQVDELDEHVSKLYDLPFHPAQRAHVTRDCFNVLIANRTANLDWLRSDNAFALYNILCARKGLEP